MKTLRASCHCLAAVLCLPDALYAKVNDSEADKPNILFLAVDDLNDWGGCHGGHPRGKTPNIDRLARKGVLFEQAYCAAPLCHPSRTAVVTGLRPSTTGIYGKLTWFRDHPKYKDCVTIPQYLRSNGYIAWTGGKVFHQPHGKWSDPQSWNGQYTASMGTQRPAQNERYRHGLQDRFTNEILARLIDWSPIPQTTEETPDWKTADGAAGFLQQVHGKPFFPACGIYRPHLQWYAPKKFFDMHPIDQIELPPYLLKVNWMQDGIYATPAIAENTIYVRTHSLLYAFKDKDLKN